MITMSTGRTMALELTSGRFGVSFIVLDSVVQFKRSADPNKSWGVSRICLSVLARRSARVSRFSRFACSKMASRFSNRDFASRPYRMHYTASVPNKSRHPTPRKSVVFSWLYADALSVQFRFLLVGILSVQSPSSDPRSS